VAIRRFTKVDFPDPEGAEITKMLPRPTADSQRFSNLALVTSEILVFDLRDFGCLVPMEAVEVLNFQFSVVG
jgi:hypothetical protein